MSKPKNTELYNLVKNEARKKFKVYLDKIKQSI